MQGSKNIFSRSNSELNEKSNKRETQFSSQNIGIAKPISDTMQVISMYVLNKYLKHIFYIEYLKFCMLIFLGAYESSQNLNFMIKKTNAINKI